MLIKGFALKAVCQRLYCSKLLIMFISNNVNKLIMFIKGSDSRSCCRERNDAGKNSLWCKGQKPGKGSESRQYAHTTAGPLRSSEGDVACLVLGRWFLAPLVPLPARIERERVQGVCAYWRDGLSLTTFWPRHHIISFTGWSFGYRTKISGRTKYLLPDVDPVTRWNWISAVPRCRSECPDLSYCGWRWS